jgi:hypothetical protein
VSRQDISLGAWTICARRAGLPVHRLLPPAAKRKLLCAAVVGDAVMRATADDIASPAITDRNGAVI